jgi:hypothetical protein
MNKEHIKPFGWGAACGAAGLLVVLFATGWMVTASSAASDARSLANKAMVDSLAPICVSQFRADPANGQMLAELKAADSWKQYQFVQDGGWSTMPGAEKPADSDVARECARIILAASS